MAKLENNGAWFVKFPTYIYNEDVKSIARKNGLKVVDIRYQGDMEQLPKAPKLTINKDFEPAETPLAKAEKEIAALKAQIKKG